MKKQQFVVEQFINRRSTMREHNKDQEEILSLLWQEIHEVAQVLHQPDKLAQELPDAVWFLCTIALNAGIDMEAAFNKKADRNELKYPAEMFNNGLSYQEAATLCRALWAEKGGDDEFYKTEG